MRQIRTLGEEAVGGEGEAAENVSVPVDEGGEVGVVAGLESCSGVSPEGDELVGALEVDGGLQGRHKPSRGNQPQRVLADEELENGSVAVTRSSVSDDRSALAGAGQ